MRNTLTSFLFLIVLPGLALAEGHAMDAPVVKAIETPKGPTPQPSPIEIDPLTLYVRTVYPDDTKTVGGAAQYLLDASGYRLVTDYPASSSAGRISNRSLPPIAKIHRTMPVVDALQLLIGDDNWVVVDHAHRLVSFAEEK